MPKPFMEHPSGQFDTAINAMADAVLRLRSLSEWKDWITFCAQGAGQHEDGYHIAEVRMLGELIDPGIAIDVDLISRTAGVSVSSLIGLERFYKTSATTPGETARILDAIFRNHLGIRPFPDEGDDYAVGAEW